MLCPATLAAAAIFAPCWRSSTVVLRPISLTPNYVCDAIDGVNSDVDIAHLIYSGAPIETENPNLPHMFIAVGADDQWEGSLQLFEAGL